MCNISHVIHVSTVHPVDDTRIFEKECKGLVKAGYKITLIIQSDFDTVKDGVVIKALSKPKTRFHRFTKTMIKALFVALREKGDIYHLHDPELLPLGILLRILGRNVVYDMHENLPEQIKDKLWVPKLIRMPLSFMVKILERISLNHMGVIMAEQSYCSSYNWVKNQQVILNYPMLDELEKLSNENSSAIPSIGYIGGVTRNRGAINVVDAIRKVRDNGYKLNYECVGPVDNDVANDASFQSAIEEGWLNSTGRLPPSEGWSRISGCQIGVAVLRPIGNYVESYPTKMFEYMAMGLPVIVSSFPLYKKIIDRYKCGFSVEPDDINAIENAICFLLENPESAKEMGENGKQAVLYEFNWNCELDKLSVFYNSLVATPH